MTNSQSQFLKDKELSQTWTAMAGTDNFQKVLAYARGALLEGGGLTPEAIHGINMLATMLVTICDTQEPVSQRITTGLRHDLDLKRSPTGSQPPTKHA